MDSLLAFRPAGPRPPRCRSRSRRRGSAHRCIPLRSQQVGPDLREPQHLWRFAEMLGKLGHGPNVSLLGVGKRGCACADRRACVDAVGSSVAPYEGRGRNAILIIVERPARCTSRKRDVNERRVRATFTYFAVAAREHARRPVVHESQRRTEVCGGTSDEIRRKRARTLRPVTGAMRLRLSRARVKPSAHAWL
jgi:hypothetical protein